MHELLDTTYLPLRRWAKFYTFPTEQGLRAIYRHRACNGFSDAFFKVGRTIIVDTNRFWEIAKENCGRRVTSSD